jgi:hypothetical protein
LIRMIIFASSNIFRGVKKYITQSTHDAEKIKLGFLNSVNI